MIESDISDNINADCETPMCHAMECEIHHPDCMCDACCQLTDSICDDNDQCEETHQRSGGKKMKNRLMPILANSVALLVVITLSVLNVSAQNIDRSIDLSTVPTAEKSVIAVDYVRNGVVLDYIHAIEDLDIARTIDG